MFGKVEDLFLDLFENTKIVDAYYSYCRKYGKVKEFLYDNPKNFFKNIFKYRKFLTNDHWWDYHYFFQMLQLKLTKDAMSYSKYGISLNNDKYVCQMMECVVILERLIEDEYEEKAFEKIDKKWGKLEMSYKPYKDDLTEMVLTRDNIHTEQDEKQSREQSNSLYKKSYANRIDDIEKLFGIMNKNILYWWD